MVTVKVSDTLWSKRSLSLMRCLPTACLTWFCSYMPRAVPEFQWLTQSHSARRNTILCVLRVWSSRRGVPLRDQQEGEGGGSHQHMTSAHDISTSLFHVKIKTSKQASSEFSGHHSLI
jgi:hypothetical protein